MLQTKWALLRIVWLVFLGLMTNICHAQDFLLDYSLADPKQPHFSNERRIRQEDYRPEWKASSELINHSFIEDIRCPSTDYWDDYLSQPSYKIEIEYVGLHSAIYNQLERLANRYYKAQMKDYWAQSYSDPIDLERRVRKYNLEVSDFHNQWWHRPWYDSLPPEKGGQITYKQQIGCKTDIVKVGPIRLSNEGRFSWQSWKFDVEDNQDTNLTDQEALETGAIREKYNLGLRSPEAEVRDDWYEMKFSAKVNVRADNFSAENKTEIGCTFKLMLLNTRHQPYLRFQVSAKFQPMTGRAELQFQLNLLEF